MSLSNRVSRWVDIKSKLPSLESDCDERLVDMRERKVEGNAIVVAYIELNEDDYLPNSCAMLWSLARTSGPRRSSSLERASYFFDMMRNEDAPDALEEG